MTFTLHKSTVRTIRQGEQDFMLTNGMVQYPRAMLHITPECPQVIRDEIMWAVNSGYLKCVAHVHDKELVWDRLNHE